MQVTSGAADLASCFEALLESNAAPIAVISTIESRYVHVNQAMAELWGYTREEILSADPFAFALRITHPEDRAAEQQLFAELISGTRRWYRIEKRYVRPDGSERWVVLTFSGIFGAPIDPAVTRESVWLVVLHAVDVTELHLAQEALRRREDELRHAQKLDGLGQLAAGIAHDFNNLLTVIIGYGESMREPGTVAAPLMDERTRQSALNAILDAADRAASLTAQLLLHARREGVVPQVLVLSEAVSALLQLLTRTLGQGVVVNQSIESNGAVFADRGQIGQIVMNLVLNARDATASAGAISIATRDIEGPEAPGPGQWVALKIADTGHGMAPEVQQRMFEPFFTTRQERAGSRGAGLGLATVRRIVEEANGHIVVDSKLGQGTSITVYFQRVSTTIGATPPVQVPAVRDMQAARRILVVEGQPAVRALVASVLLGAQHWVMTAANTHDALEVAAREAEPFSLVVTDLSPTAEGGLELAARLREAGHAARLLFLTGSTERLPRTVARIGDTLAKPFTPSQLLVAVERALAHDGPD
jgi:two-component system, cell cycle sensor histidine kinase and response regulator CckA